MKKRGQSQRQWPWPWWRQKREIKASQPAARSGTNARTEGRNRDGRRARPQTRTRTQPAMPSAPLGLPGQSHECRPGPDTPDDGGGDLEARGPRPERRHQPANAGTMAAERGTPGTAATAVQGRANCSVNGLPSCWCTAKLPVSSEGPGWRARSWAGQRGHVRFGDVGQGLTGERVRACEDRRDADGLAFRPPTSSGSKFHANPPAGGLAIGLWMFLLFLPLLLLQGGE